MADMERILNIFREYGDDYWTLRQQILFLRISTSGKEGITLTELEEECKISQQATSTNCKGLAVQEQSGPGGNKFYKGYDLIEIEDDIHNAKRKRARLTLKGAELVMKLNEELNRTRR